MSPLRGSGFSYRAVCPGVDTPGCTISPLRGSEEDGRQESSCPGASHPAGLCPAPPAAPRRRSMTHQREEDLQRDQDDDDDLERLHPRLAGLLDEEVVDVADGLELAADRL